jgi:metallo-beta-lactamase family protein
MKWIPHGAAQTVTGSKHLIEINGKRLLLECGLFQGKRQKTYDYNLNFDFDPHTLDAVILSHAHIDHSGNLPNLVKKGYQGPIFASHATCDLAEIMLMDSGHIHEYDAYYVNKKRQKQNLPPVEPLYTKQDAERTIPCLYQSVTINPLNPALASSPASSKPDISSARLPSCSTWRKMVEKCGFGSRVILVVQICPCYATRSCRVGTM